MNNMLLLTFAYFIGFLGVFFGFVWGLVLAFQEDVIWGLIYWCIPLASLVFYIKKWHLKKVRQSFFMQIIGWPIILVSGGVQIFYTFHYSFDSTSTIFKTTIYPSDYTKDELPSPFPPTDLNVSVSPTHASSPSNNQSPQLSQAPVRVKKDDFRQSMKLGYVYYAQRDYQTALINFKRALQVRPGDAYAVKAVDNTKMAIAGSRTK